MEKLQRHKFPVKFPGGIEKSTLEARRILRWDQSSCLKFEKQCDPSSDHWAYVYAIGQLGAVRIGASRDIEKRRYALQCSNPRRLRVLGFIRSTYFLEEGLHRKLEAEWIRGEWFRMSDRVRSIIRLMNTDNLTALIRFCENR
jgi:hypothetical protein